MKTLRGVGVVWRCPKCGQVLVHGGPWERSPFGKSSSLRNEQVFCTCETPYVAMELVRLHGGRDEGQGDH